MSAARFALVLVVALAGCRPAALVGHFGNGAFYHSGDHYRVRYDEGRIMPAAWRLANFEHDREGRPTVASRAPGYWDGPMPRRRLRTGHERFDLHFQGPGGEMFARSIRLAFVDETLSAEAIVESALAGRNGVDVIGRPLPAGTGMRIVSRGPARVDGEPAFVVTFDLSLGVSAPGRFGGLGLSPPAEGTNVSERITLVALRSVRAVPRGRAPVLLLFGYASYPQRHSEHRAVFQSLVDRVDLR